jgi:glycosyltransferase involved in cell wall biosynthesis
MSPPSVSSQVRRRVLQVITPSRMSGAEMQLVRLTHRMSVRGHSLATIIKRNSPAIEEMRRLGLQVDALPIQGKANVWAPSIIARRARQHRAELIQSTLSTASWWCGWLERFGGLPSIGHVQGFTSAIWHRRQTHLLPVSQAVKQHLVEQGLDPSRMTVLHNALAPDDFRPTRERVSVRSEFGAGPETPVIGTFAHLSVKKGHRELLQAVPAVLREVPDAQFWIVGQGSRLAELRSRARELGISANLRFLGYRRDVADLMNAIDVMALPSHREPCALVYIEAALSRKPIVACRAGGAPESIADGETGLLVPVRHSRGIAEALLELLTNRGRAIQMGNAGYQRALDLFGWERFIHTLEGVYERVLDERGSRQTTSSRAAA